MSIIEPKSGYWIETATGRKFDLAEPDASHVCIEDITHSLSMICRYSGHCRDFYSVAQHSVHMAERFRDPHAAMAALLHDAGEAYYGDIARPMKQLLGVFEHEYKAIRNKIDGLIENVFDVQNHVSQIKQADAFLMQWEARWLMKSKGEGWTFGPLPASLRIEDWPSLNAWNSFSSESQFLRLHQVLCECLDSASDGPLLAWQKRNGITPCF